MVKDKNIALEGNTPKPIVTDVFYKKTGQPKPVVVFCHGYKGFKDWGAWNLVAEKFAKNNFFFVKFNFSHNGGTVEDPIDFPDLNAFAEDNFSKQLHDLESVIEWVLNDNPYKTEIDTKRVYLVGHSRGGGIVTLKSAKNKYVSKIASFAGVSNLDRAFPKGKKLKKWKEAGVYHVKNGRTKQKMPHNYQFYEDYQVQKNHYSIKKAIHNLKIPQLIVHAMDDETVKVKDAQTLYEWSPNSELYLIEKGGHTFGAKHPWTSGEIPEPLEAITDKTISFFQDI